MNGSIVTVIRGGITQNISDHDLHLGDLVLIQTGDIVPADLKLIESRSLEVDEFDVTGELLPVLKKISSADVFVYMGSRIIQGSAKGIVVALGSETVYGEIVNQVASINQTPKNHQIELRHSWILLLLLPAFWQSISRFPNWQMTTLFYISTGILLFLLQQNEFIVSFFRKREQQRNNQRDISIRYSDIFSLLERIDTICFDKTGVLTTRHMEISNIFMFSSLKKFDTKYMGFEGSTQDLIRTASALCTDISFFEKVKSANPVDYAFISLAQRAGVNLVEISSKFHRNLDGPFDSEKRYMYCGYVTKEREQWYFLKGDPDHVVLQCKDYIDENNKKRKLDFNFRSEVKALSRSISQNGDTAIAMAFATGDVDPRQKEYTFLCMAQLENSLQDGAKEIVEGVIKKGIRPLLLTGDKPEAAVKIAHTCGIAQKNEAALSGNVIDRMPLDEVGRQAEYCSVFSKLLPSQKATIIRLLQNKGHHVMMVGDGPNDGIALRVADIGVSFKYDSSQIARRYSSILLNRLTDLSELIDGGINLKMRIAKLRRFMILISMVLLFVVYLVVFIR